MRKKKTVNKKEQRYVELIIGALSEALTQAKSMRGEGNVKFLNTSLYVIRDNMYAAERQITSLNELLCLKRQSSPGPT